MGFDVSKAKRQKVSQTKLPSDLAKHTLGYWPSPMLSRDHARRFPKQNLKNWLSYTREELSGGTPEFYFSGRSNGTDACFSVKSGMICPVSTTQTSISTIGRGNSCSRSGY